MTAQKDRLTRLLSDIGAAWAVTKDKCILANDPLEDQIAGRKTYHVHPDQSEPRQEHIQRFDTLSELEAWAQSIKRARRVPGLRSSGQALSIRLPSEWWDELRTRYGSAQGGIEYLVKREIKNV